jgi:MFS family permease
VRGTGERRHPLPRVQPVAAHTASAPELPAKPPLRRLVRDVRDTLRVVSRDPGLRFVFLSVVLLALFASTVYVAMTYSVQTVLGRGTEGVGYLGGLLAAGMIAGSLVAGTIGSRWDKRQTIMIGTALIGLLMIAGGMLFSFAFFAPVAFLGGLLLAPVMVSQDTLLHESAPDGARALIFSTKDLIVGAVFMFCALGVGGGIHLLGLLGVTEPYRLALIALGVLISAAGAAGELSILRRAR